MGRPRKTLPANGLQVIRDLASNGVQETVLAKALGMDVKTWQKIRVDDPEANAAWLEAKCLEQDKLVGSLFRQAVGAPAEYDAEGKLIRAEQPPFAPAGMFLLKTRHGYREQGPSDGASEGPKVNLVFNLPAPLNGEQYRRLVEVHPSALPGPEAREAA